MKVLMDKTSRQNRIFPPTAFSPYRVVDSRGFCSDNASELQTIAIQTNAIAAAFFQPLSIQKNPTP